MLSIEILARIFSDFDNEIVVLLKLNYQLCLQISSHSVWFMFFFVLWSFLLFAFVSTAKCQYVRHWQMHSTVSALAVILELNAVASECGKNETTFENRFVLNMELFDYVVMSHLFFRVYVWSVNKRIIWDFFIWKLKFQFILSEWNFQNKYCKHLIKSRKKNNYFFCGWIKNFPSSCIGSGFFFGKYGLCAGSAFNL